MSQRMVVSEKNSGNQIREHSQLSDSINSKINKNLNSWKSMNIKEFKDESDSKFKYKNNNSKPKE